MRTYQVTQREGERMGDIDWNYNFRPHFDLYCCNEERKQDHMCSQIENLWQVERLFKKGATLRVTEGDFSHDLLDVGMYDGWPYWRPVPSVCIRTVLGGFEWRQFPSVDYFEVRATVNSTAALAKQQPAPTV